MASGNESKAADVRGPQENEICVVAVSAVSAVFDLEAAAQFGNAKYQARFCNLVSDVSVGYFWSDVNTGTAALAATAGATRCSRLPAGVIKQEKPAGRYLVAVASGAGTLEVSIAEELSPGVGRTT